MTDSTFPVVQTPPQFLENLISEIDTARTSVCIQSMNFEVGEVLSRLSEAVIKASKRGVTIRIHRDWVADVYVHGEIPILPIKDPQKRSLATRLHSQNKELAQRLQEAGIQIEIVNTPSFPLSLFPITGRNHIKMYLVDDTVGWMGGVNLLDEGFKSVDLMVKFRDPNILSLLQKQFEMVNKKKAKKDYRTPATSETSLVVDTGIKGKSLIYTTAIEMVRSATSSIFFISQFLPDAFLLRELLKKAKKGIAITVVTSPITADAFSTYPQKFSYLYFLSVIKNYPSITLVHLKRKVHAKLLLIDEKHALFGSHNMTIAGVILGTEEIMINTTHPPIISQLVKFSKDTLSF